MPKEKEYIEQLQQLGVYAPAFKPLVHELCIQERELSRLRKELSKAKKEAEESNKAPPALDSPIYTSIRQLQTSTLAYRDALGLTPKALRKLKTDAFAKAASNTGRETPLSLIQKKHGKNRNTNATA